MMRDFLDYLWNNNPGAGRVERWTSRVAALMMVGGTATGVVCFILGVVLWIIFTR